MKRGEETGAEEWKDVIKENKRSESGAPQFHPRADSPAVPHLSPLQRIQPRIHTRVPETRGPGSTAFGDCVGV